MAMENQFATMRVWIPKSAPGVHPPALVLNNPNALMFFLEALSQGNYVFPAGEEFTIVAYQGDSSIGYGTYKVHFSDVGSWDMRFHGETEPVTLEVTGELGGIIGIIQEAWRNMIDEVHAFDGINYEE